MRYYCNPLNLEYRYQFSSTDLGQTDQSFKLYREAADPSLVYFKSQYYMFTSMTAGFFTSGDLIQWTFHEFLSEMPVYDYAPDVCVVGEYLYFSASKREEVCPFYRTKDPLKEPFEKIEGTFDFWDPHLFFDDDHRLYFYWGCSNVTPIYGVELDPETMKPLNEPMVMLDSNERLRGYERMGEDHFPPKTEVEIDNTVELWMEQIKKMPEEELQAKGGTSFEAIRTRLRKFLGNRPYVEGAWVTKYQGKYYLQYAVPGTEYNVYADGVFTADSPLGPYKAAENNPYSYKPGGFITGAGHGSTLKDQKGNYWHAATMRISRNVNFERRIGLWKAGFDDHGNLFCDQRYGDWPVAMEAPPFSKPEWMLLSYGKRVKVSSGQGAEYVTDENIRTWWKAQSNKAGEWVEIDLGEAMDIHAVQVNFADDVVPVKLPDTVNVYTSQQGARYLDLNVQQTRWTLEGSVNGTDYFVLCDKTSAATDYAHDFWVNEAGLWARYIRLIVRSLPYDKYACVSGLRVFGNGNGPLPCRTVPKVCLLEDGLSIDVCWPDALDAVGHNILWGFSKDKLYHNYMVFGKNHQTVRALIKGQPLYIRVDAFNENGITEGKIQCEKYH